jgi:hypothetical protein
MREIDQNGFFSWILPEDGRRKKDVKAVRIPASPLFNVGLIGLAVKEYPVRDLPM